MWGGGRSQWRSITKSRTKTGVVIDPTHRPSQDYDTRDGDSDTTTCTGCIRGPDTTCLTIFTWWGNGVMRPRIRGLGYLSYSIVRILIQSNTQYQLELYSSNRLTRTRLMYSETFTSQKRPTTVFLFSLSKFLTFLALRTTTELLPPPGCTVSYVHPRSSSFTGNRLSIIPLSWSQDMGVPWLKMVVVFLEPSSKRGSGGLLLRLNVCGTKVGLWHSSLGPVRHDLKTGCLSYLIIYLQQSRVIQI